MKKTVLPVFLFACMKLAFAQTISLQPYASGFSSPVDIAHCGDERLFIVEQSGKIRIIDGQGNLKPQPFLDIDSIVINGGGERGLLGLAFHPAYKTNGYFFVYYINTGGNIVIARYHVTANRDVADAASRTTVITIPHPNQTNHNGGNLEFGPDGYLYIGTGDGGGGGDPYDNGQDPLELLGKMLRLDVDSLPYSFPPDNPYYGFASARNEIWAMGLRNPWRFSFDRLTGDLWIGDVGQNAREEVDFQPASSAGGENYGWKCYEGNSSYGTSGFGCNGNYTFPVYEYVNPTVGRAVVGGYVYRGCKYPALFGQYLFADEVTDRVWTMYNSGGSWIATEKLNDSGRNYSTFGEDQNGEIYIAALGNGTIYHITETTSTATLPAITASPGTTFCSGSSVTLSTQSGSASYSWTFNGNPAGSGLQITAQQEGDYTLTATGFNGCVYTTPATTLTESPSPVPVITASSDSFCTGDSVLLSTTASFSAYSWSDGSTAAAIYATASDTFYVTVTNSSGCSGASGWQIVTENPLPQPVVQQTGALCGGATVALSTTAAFSAYAWSTGDNAATASVAQAGSYDVTVTDNNGCAGVSQAFTVVQQSVLTPVITSTNGTEICSNETTVLFANGNYTSSLWSTGDTTAFITVNNAGGYSVFVTDTFGCSGSSDTLEVTTLQAPAPVIFPGSNIEQCGNGVVEIFTAAAYEKYHWSRGDTTAILFTISSGTFNVTVEDTNGCQGVSDSIAVKFYPNPPQPQIFDEGALDGWQLICLDSGYLYQWYMDGAAVSGETNQTLQYFCPNCPGAGGYVQVEITDSNGCSAISDSVLSIWEGIEETWLGSSSIQPNPFTDEILLSYSLKDVVQLQISLKDLAGKEIAMLANKKQGAGSYTLAFNTAQYKLSAGIYFLEIANGNSKKAFKVVKR